MEKNIQDQVSKIQDILSKDCPDAKVPHYKFTFGKYAGKTLLWVKKNNEKYLYWCYQNDVDLPVSVMSYIEDELIH